MKKNLLLCLSACLFLTVTFTDNFAGDERLYRKAKKEDRLLSLSDQINRLVEYPTFARENNLEGIVRLSYIINENNQIQIQEIQCPNTELRNYVYQQINEKTVAAPGNNPGTLKYMKLSFKLN
jgi:hypothetical protein